VTPTITQAICLAAEAHAFQVDKQGQSYILHCLAVMLDPSINTEELRIVAVLHDILEDTSITRDNLLVDGYSEQIVDAIDALSRRPEESYTNYIERLAQNALAVTVKLADLKHNISRLDGLDPAIRIRLKPRYYWAQEYLWEVQELRQHDSS